MNYTFAYVKPNPWRKDFQTIVDWDEWSIF